MNDAQIGQTEGTTDLHKTETQTSKKSKKTEEDAEGDEEDNSLELNISEKREPGRPALTKLQFTENPDPFEYQPNQSQHKYASEKRLDSQDRSRDRKVEMVNQDSSPLSPLKKRPLGVSDN